MYSLPMYFIISHATQNFFIKPVKLPSKDDLQKNKAEDLLDLIKYQIETKTIRGKETYLLHDLLKGLKYLSEEHDLQTSVIEHTNGIAFSSGEYLVQCIDINLFTYSIARVHGCGL